MKKQEVLKSDVLIIGTGVAGLALSLYLKKSHLTVNIVTKSDPAESSSSKAIGGIACVTAGDDSFSEHIDDTLIAGDGLCDKKIVEMVVQDAPERIKDLKSWGVKFTGGNSKPSLGREGGHSKRRILHHWDNTGEEVETKLLTAAQGSENIRVFAYNTVVNLIVKNRNCIGAYVLDNKSLRVKTFLSKVVVLATGGCGKVYLYTSNPDVITGDGIAMASRAKAAIANMEFIQFHPTYLYSHHDDSYRTFLITEAIRGEGARLINRSGEEFMKKYDVRGELAPRDIVARAIDNEMKKSGSKYLYIDIHSYRTGEFIKKRFPSTYKKLKSLGMDITKENIPIVPAAHYCCGGVHVDSHGRTNINGLMAIGEASHTGLHGANRLASNSLLEALVYAKRAAVKIPSYIIDRDLVKVKAKPWEYTGDRLPEEQVFIEHNWESIRRLMWNYVGVVRSNYRLSEAVKRLKIIEKDVNYHYWKYLITPELVELRNLLEVAKIIIKSAALRKESRGLHYNVDYPEKLDKFKKNTIISNE